MSRGLAFSLAALVQAASPAPSPPTFSVDVEAVQVDVSVARRGKPVQGLSAADFVVLDSGVPQQVELAAAKELPVNAILVLDSSGSLVGERMLGLRTAASAFLDGLKPGDRAALLTFSHQVRILSGLTPDLAAIRSRLQSAHADGMTALNDALYAGFGVAESAAGRSVLVLFTDGADNISWLSESDIIGLARGSPAVVYVVASSLATPGIDRARTGRDPREAFLEKLVATTGGSLVKAAGDAELAEAFQRALTEMRARYVLQYAPQGVAADGWHPIEVRLKGQKAELTTRPGYLRAAGRR